MDALRKKNQHLIWRTGFGPAPGELPLLSQSSPEATYQRIREASKDRLKPIQVTGNSLQELLGKGGQGLSALKQKIQTLTPGEKKQLRNSFRESIKTLNLAWLNEMVVSPAQLAEKMTLFWHGHFACRIFNAYYQELLLNILRDNALGNFGDLLRLVSKSAAMLIFLNNQQNRKEHPNENFAREVMERFTLGRGNYTETDVKESARAFTGWGFNPEGAFVFREFLHDPGSKTFLGKTGNFNGDTILDILLAEKQTAKYIAGKIYTFFVSDSPEEATIAWLADRFYQSGYEIQSLLQDIFTSQWFFDDSNIGIHIKSPVEWLVGIRRTLPMQLEQDKVQLLLQRALGQVLFFPPNVAGWPGGRNWIDSSTLMLRMRMPQLIHNDQLFSLTPKPDDDVQMGMPDQFSAAAHRPGMAENKPKNNQFRIGARIQWENYASQFAAIPDAALYEAVSQLILQTAPGEIPPAGVVNSLVDKTSRDSLIRTLTIALMSTPEYQLC